MKPDSPYHDFLEVTTDILRHLSTAFIVALVSIIGIEYNARRRAEKEMADFINEFDRYRTEFMKEFERYRNEFISEFDQYRKLISENVFEAVLGRIVPEQLIQEIHEIMRIPFVKVGTQYKIRFFGPYPGMSKDYCVVRRDLFFKVLNISAEPVSFPIVSHYTSDEDLQSANWGERNFHLQLTVNGNDIPSEKFRSGPKMDFKVDLGPKDSATIFIQSEEPMRLEANRSFYYQSTPVDSIEIFVENYYPEAIGPIDIQMHHHGRGEVKHDRKEAHYTLKRAFLPGQGFEAIWRKKKPRSETEELESNQNVNPEQDQPQLPPVNP